MKEPTGAKSCRFRCLNGRHHMTDSTCQFDPCVRPAIKKGWCDPHYNQQWRGKPLRPIDCDWVTLKDKIEYWLDTESSPIGCWLWPRSTNYKGYGSVNWQRKTLSVHRAYVKELGWDVPDDMQIDHLCRVRNCANPAHLEVVTPLENILRGSKPNQTHCIYGHEFTVENTYINPQGHRKCRVCSRRKSREYKQRRREQVHS